MPSRRVRNIENTLFFDFICKLCSCLRLQNLEKHRVFTIFCHTALGPLSNNLSENSVNYSIFHPYWSNCWSVLAKNNYPKPKTCNLHGFSALYAHLQRLARKHCTFQYLPPLLMQCLPPCCQGSAPQNMELYCDNRFLAPPASLSVRAPGPGTRRWRVEPNQPAKPKPPTKQQTKQATI